MLTNGTFYCCKCGEWEEVGKAKDLKFSQKKDSVDIAVNKKRA